MDQVKLDKTIKGNRGILRQLTELNCKVKELEGRIETLERKDNFLGIDIDKLKVGGTD